MSGIVLSASVRQNLLSLQSTADLLATTQNRLATGKKVNSALDNPTNYFTAASLDSRASDINNLLDGIGNGVQVLQAANTGITSLQKLVDTAKSIANQALQSAVGYSTKSNVSATIAGATATDLRGTTTYTSATASSNVLYSGTAGGTTAATSAKTLGGAVGTLTGSAAINAATTKASLLNGTVTAGDANALVNAGDTFTVNGKTITFAAGDAPGVNSSTNTAPAGFTHLNASANSTGNVYTDTDGNAIIYLGGASGTPTKASVGDVMAAIDIASGAQSNVAGVLTLNAGQTASTITAGVLALKSSTGADLSITGKADTLAALKLTGSVGAGNATVGAARTTATGSLGNLIQDGSTLNVDGKTITFKNAPTPAASATHTGVSGAVETDGNGNSTVYLQAATVADVLNAIDLASGVQTATLAAGGATFAAAAGQTASSINSSGSLQISTGTNADLSIVGTGNALSSLGLTGNTGTVKTLDQLNAALLANNLTATVDSAGKLTISATNDYASSTLGSATAGGAI